MKPPEDQVRLLHMFDSATEAVQMAKGKSRQDLDHDRQLNLSLVRLLEVVGEAAGRVSAETQAQHPAIDWPDIISLRNRLIHGYDSIDFNILWDVIQDDLPKLIADLRGILGR
jgi:uncharacterized protein with HEPN domain